MEVNSVSKLVFKGLIPDGPQHFIPEDLFVNYFLPRFMGRVLDPGNWVVEWISIAGSPTAEVGVRDPNGNVLFTVPPLLHTKGLVMNKENGDLGDIFGRYLQMKNNLPQVGTKFLFQKLGEKSQEFLDRVSISKEESSWMYILLRYGYIQEDMSSPGVNGSSDPEDLFDFG